MKITEIIQKSLQVEDSTRIDKTFFDVAII